jgi:hypothetical protein
MPALLFIDIARHDAAYYDVERYVGTLAFIFQEFPDILGERHGDISFRGFDVLTFIGHNDHKILVLDILIKDLGAANKNFLIFLNMQGGRVELPKNRSAVCRISRSAIPAL